MKKEVYRQYVTLQQLKTRKKKKNYHNKCLWKVPVVGKLARVARDVVGRVGDADITAVLRAEVDDILDELLDELNSLLATWLTFPNGHQLELGPVARGYHVMGCFCLSTS